MKDEDQRDLDLRAVCKSNALIVDGSCGSDHVTIIMKRPKIKLNDSGWVVVVVSLGKGEILRDA